MATTTRVPESNSAVAFLRAGGMYVGDLSFDELCAEISGAVDDALSGVQTGISAVVTPFSHLRRAAPSLPTCVIHAAREKLHAALVSFSENGALTLKSEISAELPDFAAGPRELFVRIARLTTDLVQDCGTIGVCLGYPIQMSPDGDAVFEADPGFSIRAQLLGAYGDSVIEGVRCVVCNPAVATMLASEAVQGVHPEFESAIGCIVDPDAHACYEESRLTTSGVSRRRIVFLDLSHHRSRFVTDRDTEFDVRTRDSQPDGSRIGAFGKMLGGRYLGPYVLAVLHAAARDGAFSPDGAKRILALDRLSSSDLSLYLGESIGGAGRRGRSTYASSLGTALMSAPVSDGDVAASICRLLVSRAACFSAAVVGALAMRSGAGRNPDQPMCLVLTGPVFENTVGLRAETERILTEKLADRHGYRLYFAEMPFAALVGAAVAARRPL